MRTKAGWTGALAILVGLLSGCQTTTSRTWVGPVSPTHLTVRDSPPSTAIYRAEGNVVEGSRHSAPLGPLLCAGVPCDVDVPGGTSIIATSPEFPWSAVLPLPVGPAEVQVEPGSRLQQHLAYVSMIVAPLAGLTGAALIDTRPHNQLTVGLEVATIAGGLALSGLSYVWYRNAGTHVRVLTPDGVFHF